jgi:hypothetical protein
MATRAARTSNLMPIRPIIGESIRFHPPSNGPSLNTISGYCEPPGLLKSTTRLVNETLGQPAFRTDRVLDTPIRPGLEYVLGRRDNSICDLMPKGERHAEAPVDAGSRPDGRPWALCADGVALVG